MKRTLENILRPLRRLVVAIPALALALSSCDTSEIANCFEGLKLRVVVSTSANQPGSGWIGEGDIDEVMFYVFDQNGILLDVFPTTVGKEELLYYPRATKLNIVATANIDPGQMDLTPVTVGTTKIDEVEAILRQAGNYLSHNYYSYPADIFSGKLTIDNVDTQGTVDLPIRRLVSAVMVRIKGLKEHIDAPAATDDDFVVILSTQYNKVNFHGQAGLSTRSDCPVPYKLTGISRIAYGKEYHEFPGQTSGDRTDYVRIISTYEGSAVTVGVYYKDQPVAGTPITTYSDGSPIMVVNDQLNVIEISFQSGAGVTVKLRNAQWSGVLEIEKDFEE